MQKNRISTLITIFIAAVIIFVGYFIVNKYMASNYAKTLNNTKSGEISAVSDTSYESIILTDRWNDIHLNDYKKTTPNEFVLNIAQVISSQMEWSNVDEMECYKKNEYEYILLLEQSDSRVYFYVNTKSKECDFEIDTKTYRADDTNIIRDVENFKHNSSLLKTVLTDKVIFFMRNLAENQLTKEDWKDCQNLSDEELYDTYIKAYDKEVIYNQEKIYIMYEMEKSYMIIKYNYNSKKYCGFNYLAKK